MVGAVGGQDGESGGSVVGPRADKLVGAVEAWRATGRVAGAVMGQRPERLGQGGVVGTEGGEAGEW